MTLTSCDSCAGFLPPTASACPHCGAAVAAPATGRGLGGKLLAAAGSGMVALTLMACYGGGPDDYCYDDDDDGYYSTQGCGDAGVVVDCDDNNADIHPGAEDPADDGIDQNCDGVDGVAEETSTTTMTSTDSSTTDASTTDASTTDMTTTDATTTDATTTGA